MPRGDALYIGKCMLSSFQIYIKYMKKILDSNWLRLECNYIEIHAVTKKRNIQCQKRNNPPSGKTKIFLFKF